jgi:hypothetical protein
MGQYDGLDESDSGPVFKMHVADESGTAALAIWDHDDIPTHIMDSNGRIEPDALLIRNATPKPAYDDDDDVDLTFSSDRTTIEPAQIGTGATATADAGQNDELATTDGGTAAPSHADAGASDPKDVDDTDQDDAGGSDQSATSKTASGDADDVTDTESNPSNERIDERIIQETTKRQTGDGADQDAVAQAVADDLGITPERAANRIDTLLANDRGIYKPLEDTLKPL